MQRSEALAPLSRDHHQALAVALVLKRLRPGALERLAEFWSHDGPAHFAIEERVLKPGLLPGDDQWRLGIERMVSEHRALEELAGSILVPGDGGDPELPLFGRLLDEHVRFEERELFPLLEQRLDRGALERLGQQFERHERGCGRG